MKRLKLLVKLKENHHRDKPVRGYKNKILKNHLLQTKNAIIFIIKHHCYILVTETLSYKVYLVHFATDWNQSHNISIDQHLLNREILIYYHVRLWSRNSPLL